MLTACTALIAWLWLAAGWRPVASLALAVAAGLVVLGVVRPDWFTRLVSGPGRRRWLSWFYRRHWHRAIALSRLAPSYPGRVAVQVLGRAKGRGCTGLV